MAEENIQTNAPEQDLSEILKVRREKLAALRAEGRDPFKETRFDVTHHAQDIKDNFDALEGSEVRVAGRLMSKRGMGKVSFCDLQDKSGRIQLYARKDEMDEEEYNRFKKYDIGDIVGVEGEVFRTQRGEMSVRAKKITLLSKSLRPLPEKYHGLTDKEARYRQRYVDLIINPESKRNFEIRSKFVAYLRRYLDSIGFMEVETPVLSPIAGGANARPFITHHNTLDIDMYMRIATELYLKRLIVGGFEGVYEIGKNFRNEGMDKYHNPEFTCMELYVQYKDYNWMMSFTERLLETICMEVNGTTEVTMGDHVVSFKAPYRRLPILEAIKEKTGFDLSDKTEEEIRHIAKDELKMEEIDDTFGKGKLIDEIFGEFCEGSFIQPTFIIDYPVEMSPLTKAHRSKPGLTERFELMVNGKELANAYSELNDPIDQEERFKDQMALADKGDDEAMIIDQDFLRALQYGMPPTSGIGIGIDRLVMLMTGKENIQEIMLFPQMKPEKKMPQSSVKEWAELGVSEEWVYVLRKAGFNLIADIKDEKAQGLQQKLGEINKKYKLGYERPSLEDIQRWIDQASQMAEA